MFSIVANGAAIQASILADEDFTRDIIVVLNVDPLSLHIEIVDKVIPTTIPRNSLIPITEEKSFITHADDQTTVSV